MPKMSNDKCGQLEIDQENKFNNCKTVTFSITENNHDETKEQMCNDKSKFNKFLKR